MEGSVWAEGSFLIERHSRSIELAKQGPERSEIGKPQKGEGPCLGVLPLSSIPVKHTVYCGTEVKNESM